MERSEKLRKKKWKEEKVKFKNMNNHLRRQVSKRRKCKKN